MGRVGFFVFFAGFVFFSTGLLLLVPVLTARLPGRWVNLPGGRLENTLFCILLVGYLAFAAAWTVWLIGGFTKE